MPILVKHSGNIGPTALGAYGGGQGKRQAEDTRQASSIVASEREANKRRIAAEKQTKAQRDFQVDQTAKSQAFRTELADKDNVARKGIADERNTRLTREKQLDRRFDVGMEAQRQENRQASTDYELSEKQRIEYNRQADVFEDMKSSGLYNAEELADAERQLNAVQLGLKSGGLDREEKPLQYPEGQGVGERWPSDDGMVEYTRDDKGNQKEISNRRPTNQDRIKAYDSFSQSMTTKDSDGQPIPPTPEAVMEAVDKFFEASSSQVEEKPRYITGTSSPYHTGTQWSDHNPTVSQLPRKEVNLNGRQVSVPVPPRPEEQAAPEAREPSKPNVVYESKAEFAAAFEKDRDRKPNWQEWQVALNRGVAVESE